MKKRYLLYILVLFLLRFPMWAQSITKDNYTRILFSYKSTSDFKVDENGVTADSICFAVNFPDLLQFATKVPTQKGKYLISLRRFTTADISTLRSIMYHTNETYEGIYDRDSNITVIKASRRDPYTKHIFNKYFKEKYSYFDYTITIDYNAKTVKLKFPSMRYKRSFDEYQTKVKYRNEDEIGEYNLQVRDVLLENIVFFDKELPPHVTPGQLFAMSKYGVKKIATIDDVAELVNLSYE